MKKKNQNPVLIVSFIGIAAIFFFLSTGPEKFSAIVVNESGNIISTQSISTPYATSFYQSVFSPENKDIIQMQAVKTMDNEEQNFVIFTATAANPFKTSAKLKDIFVYKNNQKVQEKPAIDFVVSPGEKYSFRSTPIPLDSIQTKPNMIKINFTFQSDKEEKIVQFGYKYTYVHICYKDSDCGYIASKCDLGNIARLSTNNNVHYCVKVCSTTSSCYESQICRSGVCGY